MAAYRKSGLDLNWMNPLEGLLTADPLPVGSPPVKIVTRPARTKACPACGDRCWSEVTDHEAYRDPFLVCGHCQAVFRTNYKPLDLQYAWRDGITMPDEVLDQHADTRRQTRWHRATLELLEDPAQLDDRASLVVDVTGPRSRRIRRAAK